MILSRKRFNSGAAGAAMPVYEDGAFVSLPIAEPKPDSTPNEALVDRTDIQIGGDS